MTWRRFCKTSWRCFEDVMARSLKDILKTSWRRFKDVFKNSWRRLEDVWLRRLYCSCARRLEEVFKTSSEDVWLRWICSSWSRCLEDVFWRQRRKTSSRRLQDVSIKTNVWWVIYYKEVFLKIAVLKTWVN